MDLCWSQPEGTLGSAPIPLYEIVPALFEYAGISAVAVIFAFSLYVLGAKHMPIVVSIVTAVLLLASLGKNYFVCLSGVAAIEDELMRLTPLGCVVLFGLIGKVVPRERRDKSALVVVVAAAVAQFAFLLVAI